MLAGSNIIYKNPFLFLMIKDQWSFVEQKLNLNCDKTNKFIVKYFKAACWPPL